MIRESDENIDIPLRLDRNASIRRPEYYGATEVRRRWRQPASPSPALSSGDVAPMALPMGRRFFEIEPSPHGRPRYRLCPTSLCIPPMALNELDYGNVGGLEHCSDTNYIIQQGSMGPAV